MYSVFLKHITCHKIIVRVNDVYVVIGFSTHTPSPIPLCTADAIAMLSKVQQVDVLSCVLILRFVSRRFESQNYPDYYDLQYHTLS